MRTRTTAAAAVCVLLLSSCSEDLESQTTRLEKFVSSNKIGRGKDVWLIKHNALGQPEKVALIFGYIDDHQFCSEVAAMYMRKYHLDRYSCSFAN